MLATSSRDTKIEALLNLTLGADVVGLDVGRLDLAVLDDESVTLATVAAEDGRSVKVNLELLGELGRRVSQESDLSQS